MRTYTRQNLRRFLLVTLFFLFSMLACRSSEREIPTQTMVRIWFIMQEDSVFRSRYARPEKAPDTEIEIFTVPYGYTSADFKRTIRKMEQDEFLRRAFEESRRAYVDSLAMETLKEIADTDSLHPN